MSTSKIVAFARGPLLAIQRTETRSGTLATSRRSSTRGPLLAIQRTETEQSSDIISASNSPRGPLLAIQRTETDLAMMPQEYRLPLADPSSLFRGLKLVCLVCVVRVTLSLADPSSLFRGLKPSEID